MTEPSLCQYLISGRSGAACGVKGDPYDCPKPPPSALPSPTTAPPPPPEQCFENHECIFHHVVGGTEYSWDLHQLCRPPGAEYSYNDTGGHLTYFNVCGNTSVVCSPGYSLYHSHGVAVQVFSEFPTPVCDPKSPQCTDFDNNIPTCCTTVCSVLVRSDMITLVTPRPWLDRFSRNTLQGDQFFQSELIDESDPGKGVVLVHTSLPTS
jgi:hypothetical protein